MSWVIAIKGPILVEEVAFSDKTAVNVAILKVDDGLAFVLDMRDLFASAFAEFAMEDE